MCSLPSANIDSRRDLTNPNPKTAFSPVANTWLTSTSVSRDLRGGNRDIGFERAADRSENHTQVVLGPSPLYPG